jgi:RimJ/RimL family protein N-acetyltransferase
MRMPTLETERLNIRELTVADLGAVRAILDAEAPATTDARQQWLEWTVLSYAQLAELHQPPYGDRAVVRREVGDVVGLCGLVPCLGPFGPLLGDPPLDDPASTRTTPEVGLYWAIAPEHRRRGYATEAGRALLDYAFAALHLSRVIATTTFDNSASIGVMRKIGMQIRSNPGTDPHWLQVVGVIASRH